MQTELINSVITTLLQIELNSQAGKFGFIPKIDTKFTNTFVKDCIQALDELSHDNTENSDRKLIAISALVWTYATDWYGIENYLILFLTRRGFGPTATMLDASYRKNNSFLGSQYLINQFAIALKQAEYEVFVGNHKFLITNFQKKVWEAIDQQTHIGISAPTSAGKSFIISIKVIELLLQAEGNVVYIVPTLSLVSQVANDFRKLLKDFNLDYDIETTYNHLKVSNNKIYVLTQEKAISAFTQTEVPFTKVRALIIDEVQNVERASDKKEQRAKILFDLMIEFRVNIDVYKTIISGPRITNIGQLGTDIFGVDAHKMATKSSPVMNLTYSIKKAGKDYLFKLYCDLLKEPRIIKIQDNNKIMYGGSRYTEKYLTFLTTFIKSMKANETNIIFAPTAGSSRTIAEEIEKGLNNDKNGEYLEQLSLYLADTVHEQFPLSTTVLSGVAYHHGKLPHHVRIVIEDGIRKQYLTNIVCTTTLLQGVNLPVQNIIIRNPNLFIQSRNGERPQLTTYETANLRGRAGRLLKDFIGRTYILDEDSFESGLTKQGTLFENTEKEIKTGYRGKFEEYKESIIKDLKSNIGQETNNLDYSFILTYIRHGILKYEEHAIEKFKNVGITITESVFKEIAEELKMLTIPKDICLMNRYWDPIDLEFLYTSSEDIVLPTGASESDIAKKVKLLLKFFKDNLPVYYNRFFKVEENSHYDVLLTYAIMTENWLKEKTLKRILQGKYYDNPDKIEEAITNLQNKISFGLPMLLKPLYDIKAPKSAFLRFIELGAYRPLVRRMIELDIPRETAISIASKYEFRDPENTKILKEDLNMIYDSLNYFEKLQLQFL